MSTVLERPISTNTRVTSPEPMPTAADSWRGAPPIPVQKRAERGLDFAVMLHQATSARLSESLVEATSSTTAERTGQMADAHRLFVSLSEPRERWLRLKQLRQPQEERETRVQAALRAIESAVVHYDLDRDTMKWIAEDVDLEDQ